MKLCLSLIKIKSQFENSLMKNVFFHLISHLYLMSVSRYTLCNSTCLSWKWLYILVTFNRALKVSCDWISIHWNMPKFVCLGISLKKGYHDLFLLPLFEKSGLLLTPAMPFQRSCRCLPGHYLIIKLQKQFKIVLTILSTSWK